jgi:hypothetical protein
VLHTELCICLPRLLNRHPARLVEQDDRTVVSHQVPVIQRLIESALHLVNRHQRTWFFLTWSRSRAC